MSKGVVLLTGATGLIGKMLVRRFLENEYKLILISSNEEHLKALCDNYSTAIDKDMICGCVVDLLKENSANNVINFLLKNQSYPQYLINNARRLEALEINDYRRIPDDKWIEEYQMDVVVPYQLSMRLAEMENSKLKGIVNIASIYGTIAYNDFLCNGSKAIAIHYGVAKAGLIQLTRELAVRLSRQQIRVNSISFGGVSGRADTAFQNRYAKLCPEKKMLSEQDVTGHVMYLCSEASRGMTGHNLVVDGGFTAW